MKEQVCRGIVKGNRVILTNGGAFPDGTEVIVRPAKAPGSLRALLAAVQGPPHVSPEDVDELERMIEEGKKPISFKNPLFRKRRKRRS